MVPKGLSHLPRLLDDIRADAGLPNLALEMIETLASDYERVDAEIVILDRKLHQTHCSSEVSQRLAQTPGAGLIVSVMPSAETSVAKGFRSGRNFAAWMGLTPKNHSTA